MDKKRKRFPTISFSSAVLFSMLVLVVTIVVISYQRKNNNTDFDTKRITVSRKAALDICRGLDFADTCIRNLPFNIFNQNHMPGEFMAMGLQIAMNNLRDAAKKATSMLRAQAGSDPHTKNALTGCSELAEKAINDLQRSMQHFLNHDIRNWGDIINDIQVWVSGALTYQHTCLDGFLRGDGKPVGPILEEMKAALSQGMQLTTNALGMSTGLASKFGGLGNDQQSGGTNNSEADQQSGGTNKSGDYPAPSAGSVAPSAGGVAPSADSGAPSPGGGTKTNTRRLKSLESFTEGLDAKRRALVGGAPLPVKPDIIVAQDGTGKYKTINESLKDIPLNGNKLFVLYIKEGVYMEKITFNIAMTHLMVIGDGPTKTKITGALNVQDGATTYLSSTVAVEGDFFIAKDIGFENSAGAPKGQAVALRVGADKVIFYNCQIDGYQDTLYTHTYRQFYRDCVISGTIDFVFGDSAAVFQGCTFLVRKPGAGQASVVMAQSRVNVRQPTGIVLQNCSIVPDASLRGDRTGVQTFLGRPWTEYSRTIIMESYLGDLISPDGYSLWNGTLGIDTLYYSEFNNRGPGAIKDKRVKWLGIKELTADQVERYTPGQYIQGDSYIPPTGVPYTPGFVFPPDRRRPAAAAVAAGPARGTTGIEDIPNQNIKKCYYDPAGGPPCK